MTQASYDMMHNNGEPKQEKWTRNYYKKWRNRELVPSYVQWISTYKCNFKCPHCGTAAGEALPDELTTKEIIGAIDELVELKCRIFSVTGGETILRKDAFEVLGYAKRKGLK